MVEENFRRALLLSRGELSIFVARPISLGFVAAVLLICLLMVSAVRQRRRREVSLLASTESR